MKHIAIIDFTDCEGCQVKLVSLRERLLTMVQRLKIINWRLTQDKNKWDKFDLVLIEGTPLTPDEIETLRYLRERSPMLIGLGSCATLAGIPGIVDKKDRVKFYKQIYNAQYKPQGEDALPLSHYVKIDYAIHGCPVSEDQIARVIEEILSGKKPTYRGFSVCFECRLAGNPCRLIHQKVCLGPIGQGGCGAICVSGGSPCYACFGFREEKNIGALLTILKRFADQEEIKHFFTMFLRQSMEYQKHIEPDLAKKETENDRAFKRLF